MADSQDMLKQVPNNVSGDGKNFVTALKKCLKALAGDAERIIKQIGEGTVEQVTGLKLSVTHSTNENGPQTNIVVEFDTTNVADYSFAQIWMKEHNTNLWQQKGNCQGVKYIIENVVVPKTYDVRVVACNKNAGYADFDTAPTASIEAKGSQYICNSPAQFYWSNTNHRWEWSGYVDNGYTDFFEVRLDQKPGVWNENRLDAVEPTKSYSTVIPPTRTGTAYLYVRNIFGQYNSPKSHQYTVTSPAKPAKPTAKATLDGVVITLQALPSGCTQYVVNVDGTDFDVYNPQWTYFKFSGKITIKYCFVDTVGYNGWDTTNGRGPWSDSVELDVGRAITADDILAGAITTPKIAQGAITTTTIADDAITTQKLAAYAVTANEIASNAVTADAIKAEAVVSSKLYSGVIMADRIQAGNIATNAVTADKIQAGAVDATKIKAGSIVIGGTGNNVTINDGAINGSKIEAKSIIGDKIAANTITGSNIAAGTIDAGNIKAGALKVASSGGNVSIEDGVITSSKLATGAVTAAKIDITNGQTGARVTISNNLIEVYDGTHTFPRVRLGVWS